MARLVLISLEMNQASLSHLSPNNTLQSVTLKELYLLDMGAQTIPVGANYCLEHTPLYLELIY